MKAVEKSNATTYTRKPCPACGDKPYHPGRLVSDGVCPACKQLLAEAQSARDWKKAQKAGFEIVRVPPLEWTHWFPTFYMGERGHGGERERLEQVMAKLIYAVSERMGENEWRGASMQVPDEQAHHLTNEGFSIHGPGRSWSKCWEGCDEYRRMRPEVAQLIRDLYDAISAVLLQTHTDAKQRGQNLLLSLAQGELTIAEFNERAMRE